MADAVEALEAYRERYSDGTQALRAYRAQLLCDQEDIDRANTRGHITKYPEYSTIR